MSVDLVMKAVKLVVAVDPFYRRGLWACSQCFSGYINSTFAQGFIKLEKLGSSY